VNPERRTVLLLHGTAPGTTAEANFGHLLGPLGNHHHVLAPDLLGFGNSPKAEDVQYGPALWEQQAFDLLDEHQLDDVVLVGNSMGARVALTMATHQPGRFSGLVLMSARLHPSTSRAQDLIRAYRPDRAAMAELLTECFATDPAAVTPEMVEARYLASAAPGAHEAIQNLFATLSSVGSGPSALAIQQLDHPALVVSARGDRVVPYTDGIELSGLLPNADLHVLGGTGHWFPTERARTFTPLLLDFLGRL